MARLSCRVIITVAVGLLFLGAIGLVMFPILHAGRMRWPEIKGGFGGSLSQGRMDVP